MKKETRLAVCCGIIAVAIGCKGVNVSNKDDGGNSGISPSSSYHDFVGMMSVTNIVIYGAATNEKVIDVHQVALPAAADVLWLCDDIKMADLTNVDVFVMPTKSGHIATNTRRVAAHADNCLEKGVGIRPPDFQGGKNAVFFAEDIYRFIDFPFVDEVFTVEDGRMKVPAWLDTCKKGYEIETTVFFEMLRGNRIDEVTQRTCPREDSLPDGSDGS